MHRLFFAVVPVAHPIKVAETDVVARDLVYALAVTLYLTPDVVLLLEVIRAKVDVGSQIVCLISELLLADSLVTESAHEKPVDFVCAVVESNFAAIWELYTAFADIFNGRTLEARSNRPLHGARILVEGMLRDEACHGWVVRHLL